MGPFFISFFVHEEELNVSADVNITVPNKRNHNIQETLKVRLQESISWLQFLVDVFDLHA